MLARPRALLDPQPAQARQLPSERQRAVVGGDAEQQVADSGHVHDLARATWSRRRTWIILLPNALRASEGRHVLNERAERVEAARAPGCVQRRQRRRELCDAVPDRFIEILCFNKIAQL